MSKYSLITVCICDVVNCLIFVGSEEFVGSGGLVTVSSSIKSSESDHLQNLKMKRKANIVPSLLSSSESSSNSSSKLSPPDHEFDSY